jgi:hypothetical protein
MSRSGRLLSDRNIAAARVRIQPPMSGQSPLPIAGANSLALFRPRPSLKPATASPRREPPKAGAACTHRSDSLTEQCTFIGVSKFGAAVVITADGKIKWLSMNSVSVT